MANVSIYLTNVLLALPVSRKVAAPLKSYNFANPKLKGLSSSRSSLSLSVFHSFPQYFAMSSAAQSASASPDTNAASTNRGVSLQQLKVANLVAYILTVALNGLSASGDLSKYKIGEVSDIYPTKITPAGGGFSIWSLIYTLEALFVVVTLTLPACAAEDSVLLHGVGFWFICACMCNACWLIVFVQGTKTSLWFSTALISGLLFCLCKIYVGAQLWTRRHAGSLWQRFVRTLILEVHFSMYAGWVTVATIVNISAALSSTGWTGKPLTDSAWTIIMLCVALVLNCFIVITKNDCVWGWVLTWASAWIAVANKASSTSAGDSAVVAGSIVVSCLSAVVSAAVTGKVLIAAWGSRHEADAAAVHTPPLSSLDGSSAEAGGGAKAED